MSTIATSEPQDPNEAARAARFEWRHRQLLSATARLMERDGFHGVSMQALAEEAEVSVGLIYRYFGGKEDLLLAVIVDVLQAFATQVPRAAQEAGPDPVQRLASAFRAYCEVINDHRHAAVLTYRESKTLSAEGREKIKRLEVETSEPLRVALRDGIAAGLLVEVDVELVSQNFLLMAQGWALKRWYLGQTMDFEDYVTKQTALLLNAIVTTEHRPEYLHVLNQAGGRGGR